MNVGSLRQRIIVQHQSGTTQDEFGHTIVNWTTFLEADARVAKLRGLERYAQQQTTSTADITVTMRYRDGIDTKKRILFGERILDIESVIDVEERKIKLELSCKEAV